MHMSSALRRLFVTILVYCVPIGVQSLWDEIYPHLIEDYISSNSMNNMYILNKNLQDINRLLLQHNKNISEYDLPEITMDLDDNSTVPKVIQDEFSTVTPQEDLNSIATLNSDQHLAFNSIMEAVECNTGAIFFVDGPGGTGKTYLYRALLASVRSQGRIAIATATSGIAATLLPGGRTAHSRFKISLNPEASSMYSITKQSDLAELIRRATVIIWDEATMTNRYAFEALNRTLIDITGVDYPFGGKIMMFGGDFRQVLPVVPKGTKAETIAASLVKSPLWSHIQILRLKQNMRSINDQQFDEFLLFVGNGVQPTIIDEMIKVPPSMAIPWNGEESIVQLLEEIYPNIINHSFDAE
ncbi:ATP-dependent DNA helicase PIF2-like [Camellia sinensis]|uniref:ATP-dependent DNA helicase PIF2-like n=1 Tax=Camellia sinensis TaxID=4442 RepID=UPI001036E803|nr:ATP-dependent DNA helicase PIF2-like [Camellia sinensis]